MSLSSGGPDLASLSTLDDPVRRRLYEVVTRQDGPVGRDEAASAAGIGRALAVYHLDKLVESGLLTAFYQRPPGRSGPGAGRPAKLYARSDREFAVPLGREELDDRRPPGEEGTAVAPGRVHGVRACDALGVAGVPGVLGRLDLAGGGLRREWRQRRAVR